MKDEDRDNLFTAYRYLLIERDVPTSVAALDEKSGIDVQEILDTLQRMKVSPQAKAAGYQDTERCGLFTTLDEHAAPQLPAFVHRLCDYLVARRQEWSYEAAQSEWFWGYTWEGARPLDVYIQWMALLCDLHYAHETSTATRKNDKRYRLIERSAIRGSLAEANNWLADEYPQIVEKMKDVFGEGKVTDYFAPMQAPRPGTKTRDARQRMEDAESCLNALDIAETTWKDTKQPDDLQAKFIVATRGEDSVCEIDDIDYEDQSKRFQLIGIRQAYQLAERALLSGEHFDLLLCDCPLLLNRSIVAPEEGGRYAALRQTYQQTIDAISLFWRSHRDKLFPWNRQGPILAGLASERFGPLSMWPSKIYAAKKVGGTFCTVRSLQPQRCRRIDEACPCAVRSTGVLLSCPGKTDKHL